MASIPSLSYIYPLHGLLMSSFLFGRGYMSPEYVMQGRFSDKSDIYSFGVMVLEIITGKKNVGSCESHRFADGLPNSVSEMI